MEENKKPGDKPKRAPSSRKKSDKTTDKETPKTEQTDDAQAEYTTNPVDETKDKNEVIEVDAEPVTVEMEIKNQIAKFNIAESGINKLKEELGGLTIPDGDKDAYEAVKKGWNLVRTKRTDLEKKGLELRSNFTIITKAIKGEEDRLIKLLKPLEDDLQKKWKEVDDAKEAEKQRKKEEEEKRLTDRLELLQKEGMILSNGFYDLGGTVSMDVATLRLLPDEQFEKFLGVVKTKAAELAEQKRKEDELKAEEQRKLQEQQDQLKADQQKLQQQQEDMRKQQEALDNQKKEADKMRRELRDHKLQAVGFMVMHGGAYKFQTAIMKEPIFAEAIRTEDNILDVPAAEFDELMEHFKTVIGEETTRYNEYLAEQTKKKEAAEKRKQEVINLMQEHGFTHTGDIFIYSTRNVGNVSIGLPEMLELVGDEFFEKLNELQNKRKALIEEQVQHEKEEQRKAEEQKQKEEEDRKAKMSDKELFEEMLTLAQKHANAAIRVGELKTEEFRDLATDVLNDINSAINEKLGIKAGK